ncbi:MAG: Gfo/Idh/MocA family protein [Actinomycetes bacterium]
MRFGLVGTGYWARTVHGAGLRDSEAVDLVGVWGRDSQKTAALAGELDAAPYDDLDAMIDAVEAVAFAVPPAVQADAALRAALAGRHLLLEKPIATTVEDADRLAEAVEESGVASLVFFTGRFLPEQREWLREVSGGSWEGGFARWLGSAFATGSPYAESIWRREKGGLWDVGPHALAMLTGALGPITGVRADAGLGDLVHLVLHHEGGETSTATLTLSAPPAATGFALTLWGVSGTSVMPTGSTPPVAALGLAAAELVGGVNAGRTSHPCDVRLGRDVVHVLAEAQRQVDSISANP